MVVDYTSKFIIYEIFRSRVDLCKWAVEVRQRNGFIIVTKKLNSGASSKKPRISLACERSGQSREPKKDVNQDQKHVLSGSKKCGCSFELKSKKLPIDDDWILLVVCGVHNHSSTDHLEGHSSEKTEGKGISYSYSDETKINDICSGISRGDKALYCFN